MNCSEVQYFAPLYHSREMEGPTLQQFQEHLQACPHCLEQIHREEQIDLAIRTLREAEQVDDRLVRERVLEGIKEDLASSRRSRVRRWGIACAAIVFAFVLAASLYFRPTAKSQLTIYRDAADDHRAEVAGHMPLQWERNSAVISTLVQNVGATSDLIAKITPAGYRVDRARICTLLSHDYVHLVFTDGTHELSFFLRSRDNQELTGPPILKVHGKAIHSETIRDLNVAGFQSSGVTVLLVSDEPMPAVLEQITSAAERV